MKLTDHDLSKIAVWQQAGLKVLAGDDPILFRYLVAGVDGAMVIAPALFPEPFRRVWELVQRRRAAERADDPRQRAATRAARVRDRGEIATSKALLVQMGVFESAEVRAAARAGRREASASSSDPGRHRPLKVSF